MSITLEEEVSGVQVGFTDYTSGASAATALVNTVAGVTSDEQLATVQDMRDFLDSIGVPFEGMAPLTEDDVAQARRLRSRLRETLCLNDVEQAIYELNGLLSESVYTLTMAPSEKEGWSWALRLPEDASAVQRLQLATVPGLLAMVRVYGTARFRHCDRDECNGLFADASRAGRRRFCDPARCGNLTHVEAYRARRNH